MNKIIKKTITVFTNLISGNPSIMNFLQHFLVYTPFVVTAELCFTGEFCPKTRSEVRNSGFCSYALAYYRKGFKLFLNLILVSSLFYLLPISQVYAQAPIGKIAYQGRLTDSNNTPLTGSYNFTFKIFDAASGGNQLWSETQNSISVDNGLLSVNLGDGTPISGTIFNGATTYLEITVNTNSPMTPRIRLLPSPYAFNSQTLQGYDFSAFVSTFSAQTISGNKTFDQTVKISSLTVFGKITSTSTFQNARVTADRTTTAIGASDVTDMSFQVGVNDVWSFEINLQNGCSGGGGTKWALTFPSGATLKATGFGTNNGATTFISDVITVSGTLSAAFNTANFANGFTRITGIIVNGGTAGTVQLQFASTTSGQTSTVFANSYLTVRRIN